VSPRWRRDKPVPLAEGQTVAFDDDGLPVGEPIDGVIYICRECFSRRVTNTTPTVDPRWVIGLCLDCGDRQIASVRAIPIPKEDTEGE